MLSLQGKGATVNQVEKQKHKDLNAVIREVIDMTPGQEIVLDPKDKLKSGAQLEPADKVDQIDIGDEKSLNIGRAIQGEARCESIDFLQEHKSVFAWTAVDMPGIPRTIAGFYWPTMKRDATNLVRKCESCQLHSKLSRIPPYQMITILGAWPFDLSRIDIVGPFFVAVRQRKYIIVAVEYFTKWIETEALASTTSAAIESFI